MYIIIMYIYIPTTYVQQFTFQIADVDQDEFMSMG